MLVRRAVAQLMADEEGEISARPDHTAFNMPDSFKVADLQRIVALAGAPKVKDTFNARCVATEISMLIERLEKPPAGITEPSLKRINKFKMAWDVLAHELPILARNRHHSAEMNQAASPFSSPVAQELEQQAAQIDMLVKVMAQTKPLVIAFDRKKQGKHGPSSLPQCLDLTQLYKRLGWAWEEAGERPASQSKRYEVIALLIKKAGKSVTADAIRKAIEKEFRKHPRLKDQT